jgi:hypothetical protein
MHLGKVIKTLRQAPELAALDQSGERLVDRSAAGDVEKVARRENASAPA